MSTPRLLLYPNDPWAEIANQEEIPTLLKKMGLIGTTLVSPKPTEGVFFYQAGTDFLERIIYLGCSPLVNLRSGEAVPENKPAPVWVEWFNPQKEVVFYSGQNTVDPRCPGCKQPIFPWNKLIMAWKANPLLYKWTCSLCGICAKIHQLDWRHNAAFARCSLQIPGIYPAEALPDDTLLEGLAGHTRLPWHYAYQSHLPATLRLN